MAFKRALWHSGLTYRQTCVCCRNIITYTDQDLGYRPWFPNGFVYCPTCKKPLRHREDYAINPDGTPHFSAPVSAPAAPAPTEGGAFCTNCGRRFVPGVDHYCGNCGKKLD